MKRFLPNLLAALSEMLRPTFPVDDDPQSTAEATATRTRWIREHRPEANKDER